MTSNNQGNWLQQALAVSQMGIWRWFVERDVVEWAGGVADLLGVDASKPPTLDTFTQALPPEDQAVVGAAIERCLQGLDASYVVRHRTVRYGDDRWLEGQGRLVTLDGEPVLVGTIVDITAVVQTEEKEVQLAREIDATHHQLKQFVDALQWLSHEFVDADTDTALALVTRKVAEVMEVARVSVWTLADDNSRIECQWQFADGETKTSDAVIQRDAAPDYFEALVHDRFFIADDALSHPAIAGFVDGYLSTLGIGAMLDAPIRIGGRTYGVVCHEHVGGPRRWSSAELTFAANVADLIALLVESALRQNAERAERESAAQLAQAQRLDSIGRLAGGVAHDFNNMLTGIMGTAALIEHDAEPGTPLHDDVQTILELSRRAAELTRQLLTFARKQKHERQHLDVDAYLQKVAPILSRMVGDDVVLDISVNGKELSVDVDPSMLDQVFLNLVVNAREAMPEGGQLALRVDEVDLPHPSIDADVAPGRFVRVEFADDGPGIDDDTLPHLFEPFFTTKADGEGTGLGLATSYGVARQSDGDLRVRSVVGKGTTFTLLLPRVGHDAETTTTATTTTPSTEQARVLVVDDNESVAKVAARSLRAAGHHVDVEVESTDAAHRLLHSDGPAYDVVLCDVLMPQMTGPELAQLVREARPQQVFLFITGHAGAHAARLEGEHVLYKPFTPQQLAQEISTVLSTAKASP